MFDRAGELNTAAAAIDAESLQAARTAIAESCREYLRWAEIFARRLQTVEPADLHKFARALALTMLGHLPTRPATCPFCIQYGRDRSCQGCGYALTHGRCDIEDSAFSRFIESFVGLGRAIYQDVHPLRTGWSVGEEKRMLQAFLSSSEQAVMLMLEGLEEDSALQLMERKAGYLERMINLIPCGIFSEDVAKRRNEVSEALKSYW